MKPLKFDFRGYPSHQISPADKGKEWCLAFCKAFNGEYSLGGGRIMRYMNSDYAKYRLYSQGKQPIDQYKRMLTNRKNQGKNDPSWRNLDWNILSILPTLIAVIKNKTLGQQKNLLIKAIDEVSQNEERMRKNQILTYLINLPLMQQEEEQFGVSTESPLPPGAPMPRTVQEVELHMMMYPKARYITELYDQINNVVGLNNCKEMWDQIVQDLIDCGVGGTKVYIDVSGNLRVRRVVPEAVITNDITKPDFSDLTRVAEFVPMTVQDLRAAVPPGTFTEEQFAQMASQASGRYYTIAGNEAYYRSNYRYPYDHEKLIVMDAEWISSDDYAYVKEFSNRGNLNITKQKDPYWLNRVQWTDEQGRKHVGVTDKQYMQFHTEKGSSREVLREAVQNLYGAKWIVGTDFVYDWGRLSNMQRSLNRIGECKSNYNFYTFFDSFIRRAEPLADQIQINWLQHQHQVAKSRPSGLKINKRALTTLKVGGKSAIELDEMDLLQMYAETGNMVYKGEDAAGRSYPFDPIQELKGGLNEAAFQHLEIIMQHIDLLRTVFGLNEATDSSTPNPKLGKAVAEMMEQNTNTALGTVYHAYSNLYERTMQAIALLVPDAELIKTTAKGEALGQSSGDFFRANNDLTYREFGITIEDGPTTEVKQRLQKYIELSIQNQELKLEDAYLIENEENMMRAYWLLALKRKQKQEEDAQAQQEQYAMEEQKNMESAQATAAAKLEADQALYKAEIEKEYATQPLKKELAALDIVGKIILKKMEAGITLSQQENEAVMRYVDIINKTQGSLAVEKEKGKHKPKTTPKKKKAA